MRSLHRRTKYTEGKRHGFTPATRTNSLLSYHFQTNIDMKAACKLLLTKRWRNCLFMRKFSRALTAKQHNSIITQCSIYSLPTSTIQRQEIVSIGYLSPYQCDISPKYARSDYTLYALASQTCRSRSVKLSQLGPGLSSSL